MKAIGSALLVNLNFLVVLVGFVVLEVGIARQWSGAVASMTAGVVLMVGGAWPYLIRTLRKRT